jgi:hypothetical protein
MKFLIDNYSSHDSTQPLYLNSAVNAISKCESIIRHKDQSIYDAFDQYQPNIYITHAGLISMDLIHYIKENPSKDISMLVSVYGMNQDNINRVDMAIKEHSLPCKFLFNTKPFNVKHSKALVVKNAADINITKDLNLSYRLDKAIFIFNQSDIKEYDSPYHLISNNNKLVNIVDICSSELYLASIFSNYQTMIFENLPIDIPQAFYDAILFCDKVYYTSDNPEVDTIVGKIFKPDASLNYNHPEKLNDFSDIKKHLKQKHLGYNRLATLLSQLPEQNILGDYNE